MIIQNTETAIKDMNKQQKLKGQSLFIYIVQNVWSI